VELSPGIDAAYPQSWGAEIVVETVDGRSLAAFRKDAKGDPENPVTAAELSLKARALLIDGGKSGVETDRLIAAILGLTDDRPVRGLGLFPRAAARAETRLARSA
jgi:2-methylcitrate dehydratase PrpD